MLRQVNVNLGVRVPHRRSYVGVIRRERKSGAAAPRAVEGGSTPDLDLSDQATMIGP